MHDKAREVAVATQARAWYQVIGSKVWYFFNSLKLTLSILFSLSFLSIFGTVIEQNQPIENYLKAYGEGWTRFILYTGLNDMYHTRWFLAFLTMLILNIIVCTFERFPPKWKMLLSHKPKRFEPRLIEKFANHQTLTLNGDAATVKERVTKAFRKKRFRVETIDDSDGGECLYAWKGRMGRLGSDVVHLSLLLILLGAVLGSTYGYKDFRAIYVGGSITVPQADFSLRLDKFWIEYYDTGQVRQYNSLLTVIEDGKDVHQKQIWVNEPLYYKGIRFYQSSFGTAWNKLEVARIALVKVDADTTEPPITVKWNELTRVPGSPYSVKLIGYAADFAYDERSNTVFSKSAEADNPAINIEVYEGENLVSAPWLFMNYPGIFPAIPGGDYDMVFAGFRGINYSGISINKDPGTNVVWLGTAVMGIGFILAFFVYYRRIWVHLKKTDRSTEVKIGGLINKNNFVFEKEMNEIIEGITAGEGGPDRGGNA
jgi:cytochrome c biogenesis protein